MGTGDIFFMFSSRAEASKSAPFILALQQQPRVRVTGVNARQRREVIEPMLSVFGMTPDVNPGVMRPGQSLAGFSALLLQGLALLLGRLAKLGHLARPTGGCGVLFFTTAADASK